MAAIIYQSTIEKKRKNCGIPIESVDMKKARNRLIPPSIHRLNQ
ncbi:hypothetical protein PDR5_28990 [Pseudomonas sp. DR 5-09]|nr:hypothetical protein PDR5_28990 [Pseudomonas sp. DR 5-09]